MIFSGKIGIILLVLCLVTSFSIIGCDSPNSLDDYSGDTRLNKTYLFNGDTVQISILPDNYLELLQLRALKRKGNISLENYRAHTNSKAVKYLQIKVTVKASQGGPARKTGDVFPVYFKKLDDCVIKNSKDKTERLALDITHINNFGYVNFDQYLVSFPRDGISDDFTFSLANLFNNGEKINFNFTRISDRLADYSRYVNAEIESL